MDEERRAGGGPLALGWHTWCLAVESLPEMLDFYRRLGFSVVDGDPDKGWVGMNNAGTDLSLISGLPTNLLNFRGADIAALAEEHRRRGFEPIDQAEYDPEKYPADWHTDEEGNVLPVEGAGSYTLKDPDDHGIFFDTVPVERARQAAGQRYCAPKATGELLPDQKELGRHDLCLSVKDVAASIAFYEKLGLEVLRDHRDEGWAILRTREPNEFRLGLYRGHIDGPCMNFRGADVFAVAERLKADGIEPTRGPEVEEDGSAGAWYEDPQGNAIYLNTAPGEKA